MTLHITRHAIERYQQRVSPVSDDEAREALSSPAVQIAAQIGAQFVRLPTGQRIVIHEHTIITVQPADHYRRMIHREGLGRYGKSQHQRREQ
jgi:hypothetical protein